MLEAAGLATERIDRPSDGTDEGLVVRRIPAAGIEIPTRIRVVIVASSGPEAEPDSEPGLVEVPDVSGLAQDEAQAELEEAGFVVDFCEDMKADVPAGTAIARPSSRPVRRWSSAKDLRAPRWVGLLDRSGGFSHDGG